MFMSSIETVDLFLEVIELKKLSNYLKLQLIECQYDTIRYDTSFTKMITNLKTLFNVIILKVLLIIDKM